MKKAKHYHNIFYFLVLWIGMGTLNGFGAYLKNVPQVLRQPDGSVLKCYASGDEYHNWLHDAEGYTIVQDNKTGYYVFAEKTGNTLSSSHIIAKSGKSPQLSLLKKQINLNPELIKSKIVKRLTKDREMGIFPAPTTGIINNIVVFIRFSDESEFTTNISGFNEKFNTDVTSLNAYFSEVSYNQLTVSTTFYPPAVGGIVVSFQDTHPRSYYKAYNASTNPGGYQTDDEARIREHTLLRDAVLAVGSQVSGALNLDMDNDGRVDNVVFMVSGSPEGWNDILWPHRWSLYTYNISINGDRVYTYNFNFAEGAYSNSGVLCHEFFHSLGSPDLYHYTNNDIDPVGRWDIMESTMQPPQYMSAYMKYRYGDWIASIPEITTDGVYTLNSLTSSTNNCYKIASPNSAQEYFVVEYRRKTGTFESSLPGSGLLVYRINTLEDGAGNASGPPDEVYIYRPGGTTGSNGTVNNANFSSDVGRAEFHDKTDPTPFLANGSDGGLVITNVGSAGNTIQFRVGEAPTANPSIAVTPLTASQTLQQNETANQTLNISNNGDVGSILSYTISITGNTVPAPAGPQPSIAGSTFESNVNSYITDTTFDMVFTVTNNSPDVEWLTGVTADFPSGVTVNSSTNLTGGTSPLVSDGNTGNGVVVAWTDNDGGFGNIWDGESASTTVNVTVEGGFSGDFEIAWNLNGENYGSTPHTLNGTVTLTQETQEDQWVSASPLSGSVNQGSSDYITLHFDASGLDADSYSATLTVSHNGGSDVVVPISLTVQSGAALDAPSLTAIDIVNASQAKLTFSEVSGATSYHVYRGTTVNFTPDTEGGTNRVGASVTDGDGVAAGVQWTDTESVAGNASTNYFYRVTAMGSSQSAASNLMGVFDFDLVTTATTDFNEIGLPLVLPGVSKASDLLSVIPNCNSVARWVAGQQGYEQYIPGIPPTDFDVNMGNAYYVNVTSNGVFTSTGSAVDVSFNLTTTATTDFNEVIIGLDKTSLSIASDLMADIPSCNSVARWVASQQGYEQYIPGIPPTDFDVRVGYPYYVNVTANGSWSFPGDVNNQLFTQAPASGAPHMVWGRVNEIEIDHFEAYLKHNHDTVITEQSTGSSMGTNYWAVQCADFSGGWAIGDTLMVKFFDHDGALTGQTVVELTEHPADQVESIQVVEKVTIPETYALFQNFPNPFNGDTQIMYQLPQEEKVSICILDIQGRHVLTLVDKVQEAGEHQVLWSGHDKEFRTVSSGMYFILIQAGSFKQSRKMLFVQ